MTYTAEPCTYVPMSSVNTVNNSEHRVPLNQLVVYGAGGLIPIALFNIAGQLIGLIGNISLGLSAFWLGTILIIPRIWDGISDPLMGHISDNTRSRWGRRRPYVLIGGITVALSFVMMWWVPKHSSVQGWFPSDSAFEWFQLAYIFISLMFFYTAMTVFEIPHGALGLEMSPNPHERTRLCSAKSFFGNLFAMGTPWLFALAGLEFFKGAGGSEADGMRYVSIVVAVIMIPVSIWWFIALQEPSSVRLKNASAEKKTEFWSDMKYIVSNRNFLFLMVCVFILALGFNFVGLLNYYISIFYIFGGDKTAAGPLLGINGTIWAVTGLLAVFPLNWLAPKFGKRETLIISIVLMCAAQLSKIFCYNPTYPYLVIIPTILLSAGMLFFFTLSSAMLGDICDEDDLKTGKRNEGSYYSVFWWFVKMGTAIASFVTGILIVFTQFDETQVTRADELRGSLNKLRNESAVWAEQNVNLEKLQLDLQKESKDLSAQIQRLSPSLPGLQHLAERNNLRIQSLAESRSKDTLMGLSMSLKVDQSDVSAKALKLHFSANAQSDEHSEMLTKNLAAVQSELTGLSDLSTEPLKALQSIQTTLPRMDAAMSHLTRQKPKSLLLMRIIEIGLPILLCLISLYFALRYPLTNERCLEIQMALNKRNAKRKS